LIADSSFIVALMNEGDTHHESVRSFYEEHAGELVTTPLALAEIDHVVRARMGEHGGSIVADEVAAGGIRLEWWPAAPFEIVDVARRYPDVGLVDASLVALAAHAATTRIATLDHRRFRALRPLTGEGSFTLLPADAR
jgi:predicted nucleic acid-binding protein